MFFPSSSVSNVLMGKSLVKSRFSLVRFRYCNRALRCCDRTLRFYNRIDITEILYNHLNLPTSIYFGNGSGIDYIYNAAGQKIKKSVYDTPNNTVKHVDYLDGFQYAGEILQFFPTSEGYVSLTPSQASLGGGVTDYIFNYVYNYTDHLGNIRLSYTKDPVSNQLKIMEENHYYPFGLKHSTYAEPKQKYQLATTPTGEEIARPTYVYETDYMYKYNGKEFQDELGLGLYDYGARMYDPALGRWNVIDPLAEMYYSFSTYNYAANNPIVFIDPNGMNLDWYQSDGGDYVYDASITSQQDLTDAGIEGTYLGESASVGVNNSAGEAVGTLNLNTDGSASYTQGGQTISFTDATFNLGFDSGNQVMAGNHQTGNSFDLSYTMSQVGNVSMALEGITAFYGQYGKYSSKGLGLLGNAAGYVGTGAGVIGETNNYLNNDISGSRYAYRMTGIGTSTLAGGVAGTYGGGWAGFLLGSSIGATFGAAEVAFDVVAPQIMADFNRDMNTLKNSVMP